VRFTGERVLPDMPEMRATYLQSLAAYRFAFDLAIDQHVLDCGAGEGYGASILADRAASVVSFDAAPDAVAWACRKYGENPRLSFVAGDATMLPFADGAFDVVCCFQVIEHLAAPERFLAEARRVLTPGGALVLSTPNALAAGTGPNPHHKSELTPVELLQLLGRVFTDIDLRGVFGSARVMEYRARNRRIVNMLLRADVFALHRRLPARVSGLLHANATRLVRAVTGRRSGGLVEQLTLADFPIRAQNIDEAIDLLAIARRS
jgi:2-polyprenyl-3-methyl-5-hydroxy-6-metoxy-1,4-benzoquinol methylase